MRIEFEPASPKTSYTTQLRWAFFGDGRAETSSPGKQAATNMTGEGKDEKPVTGKVVLERGFAAAFAADRAWHNYPTVTPLGEATKTPRRLSSRSA